MPGKPFESGLPACSIAVFFGCKVVLLPARPDGRRFALPFRRPRSGRLADVPCHHREPNFASFLPTSRRRGKCETKFPCYFTGCSILASTRAALSSPPPAAFRPALSQSAILAGSPFLPGIALHPPALLRLDPACGGGSFPAPPTSCVGLPAAQAVASGVWLVATPARGPCSPPFPVGKVRIANLLIRCKQNLANMQ